MDTESNVRLVVSFLHSAGRGGDMMDYLHDDVTWWVPPHWELSGSYRKDELGPLFGQVFAMLDQLPVFVIHSTTAQDDRVAVDCESSGRFVDGRPFGNSYHFLFTIRDGRIIAVKEFMNTVVMSRIIAQSEKG